MPLQNRVLPTGDIVAIPARGTLTGNRGIIHTSDRALGTARWSHHAWICCTLDWQDRKRDVMTGRKWTELFFLDEAVAFAAGHRPCAYCRRAAYNTFRDAWADAFKARLKAPVMDKVLHKARVMPRSRMQKTYQAHADALPLGCFVQHEGIPHLIGDNTMRPFTPDGYGAPISIPKGRAVTVLTPAPTVKILRAGYRPQLHPTACLPD